MNNQTINGVPRELLLDIEYWLKHMEAEKGVEGRCSALKELRALLDKEVTGDSRAPQPRGEPVAYRCRHSATEPWFFSDKPGYWEWQALYTEQPAPVAPTPINYGALDPVERLAVCRGEVAPVAVVLPEFESSFEKWWEEDGQYCRAGGGSYEKTFAYRAYEAALADVTRLNPSL